SMKPIQQFATISWLALFLATGAVAGEEYKAADGGFRLIFPETPEETVTRRERLVLHTLIAKGNSADLANVMLIYFDHPKEQQRNLDAAEYFRGSERALLDTPNLKLLRAKDIGQGAIVGKEHHVQGFQGKYARIRHYLTGDRAYQLFVISENEKGLDSPEAEDFLSSFQVLRSQPIPVATRNEESTAYRLGYLVGQMIIFGGVVLVCIVAVVLFVRSQRKSVNRPRSP